MIDQKLIGYIKTAMAHGKSKEEIYKELLNQGATIENIQTSFNAVTSEEEKEDTQKKTIRIILTIAAILIGAGIFSFIASNWQEMTRLIKVSVIIIAMLISYSLGWYLKEKLNLIKTGEALILLGSIIYGAGIFLVAQMFNIRANWPDGFILWMIGTIIMASVVESFLLFYLSIPLGIIALAGHPFSIFDRFQFDPFLLTSSILLLVATLSTVAVGISMKRKGMALVPVGNQKSETISGQEDSPQFNLVLFLILFLILGPIGLIIYFLIQRRSARGVKEWQIRLTLSEIFLLLSVLFLGVTLLAFNRDLDSPLSWRTILFLTSIIGFLGAYYFKVIYTLAFSLIGIMSWWAVQAMEWIQGRDIKTSAILTGLSFIALSFYSLGHFHEKEPKYKQFALVYLIPGIIFITGALFFFSSKQGLGVLGDMTKGVAFFGSWQINLSLLFFFISLVGITLYSTSKKSIFAAEAVAVLLLTALFSITALLPQQSMFIQVGNYSSYYSGNELSSNGVLWAIIFNVAVFFELLGLIFSGYLRREEWLINLGTVFLFLLIIIKYFDWFFTFLDKSIFFIGAGILLFVVGWFMEKGRRYVIANIKAEQQQIS